MSQAELSRDDVGTIEGIFATAMECFLAGDFAGWASPYAEDGTIMPPNGPAVVGRANLQAFGESFPRVTRFSFSDVGVQVQGDLAVGWTAFEMSFVGDDGAEVNDIGKQLVAFEKQGDGSWKATRAIFNSDLPLE